MKKMKVVNRVAVPICLITLIIVSMLACSLDEKLDGTIPTENFIQSDADLALMVNGAYSYYPTWNLFKGGYIGILCGSSEMASPNDNAPTIGSFASYGARRYDASSAYIKNPWTGLFSLIGTLNSNIQSIEKASKITDSMKKRTIGEMYFLRGYSYFNLVRLWGGVPLRLDETTSDSNFYQKRDSVENVYKQIFADLNAASERCLLRKSQPVAEFGRATKGAAQSMLASAYLTYGNYCDLYKGGNNASVYYNLAATYADSVINSNQYSLINNYADIFNVDKEKAAYEEVIFGIQYTRDAFVPSNLGQGSSFASQFQPSTRNGVTGNPPAGKGGANIKIQPWFFNQYITGDYISGTYGQIGSVMDYRTEVSFLTSWLGTPNNTAGTPTQNYITYPVVRPKPLTGELAITRESMPYIDKYKDPKGLDGQNHENDFFIMRLSEVYLIKSEALNELGRTSEAYAPFNMLRSRARKANGTVRTVPTDLASGLSKEDFRLAVFNERGLEFVGEGSRLFDELRMRYKATNKTMLQYRYEDFYPALTTTQLTLPLANTTTGVWGGGIVQPVSLPNGGQLPLWDKKFLLLPIPSDELLKNSNFGGQNSGW
jgi:hypothetical protein